VDRRRSRLSRPRRKRGRNERIENWEERERARERGKGSEEKRESWEARSEPREERREEEEGRKRRNGVEKRESKCQIYKENGSRNRYTKGRIDTYLFLSLQGETGRVERP
jgi:hypothetical protein